jgi:hypothetical protein
MFDATLKHLTRREVLPHKKAHFASIGLGPRLPFTFMKALL